MTWTTPTNVSTGTASSSQFNTEHVGNLQHIRDTRPLGVVADNTASGASGALATIGAIVTLPDTSATITNSTAASRTYVAHITIRANMASGSNGLYRPVITDGSTSAVSNGAAQFMATVVGSSGQVGGSHSHAFTLAASASITLGAGGLRVAGGSATDTLVSGRLIVVDHGGAA